MDLCLLEDSASVHKLQTDAEIQHSTEALHGSSIRLHTFKVACLKLAADVCTRMSAWTPQSHTKQDVGTLVRGQVEILSRPCSLQTPAAALVK